MRLYTSFAPLSRALYKYLFSSIGMGQCVSVEDRNGEDGAKASATHVERRRLSRNSMPISTRCTTPNLDPMESLCKSKQSTDPAKLLTIHRPLLATTRTALNPNPLRPLPSAHAQQAPITAICLDMTSSTQSETPSACNSAASSHDSIRPSAAEVTGHEPSGTPRSVPKKRSLKITTNFTSVASSDPEASSLHHFDSGPLPAQPAARSQHLSSITFDSAPASPATSHTQHSPLKGLSPFLASGAPVRHHRKVVSFSEDDAPFSA